MDAATIAGCTAATVGVLSLGLGWMRHAQNRAEKKLNDRLRPLESSMTGHDRKHEQHFTGATKMAVAVGEIKRSVEDHIREDDKRFDETRDMLREIRDNINIALQRLQPNGK